MGTGASRKFGIELVGEVPWGTHLCQFYESKEDLIEILVPYFAEGLRNNEFCMWVTSPPLEVEEAKKALRRAVHNLDKYVKNGQIEILSYADWYLLGGKFDADRVLNGWVGKEKAALSRGFEGLRLTGNTFWIERERWEDFTNYEATVNSVISKYRMIALCTYSLEKCTAEDMVDVVRNHAGTLIRKEGKWCLVEDSSERRKTEERILKEKRYSETLINSLPGVFYVLDADANMLLTNHKFAEVTGYSMEEVLKMKGMDFFAGEEKKLIEERIREVFDKGEAHVEAYFESKDGKRIPYYLTGVRLVIDGNPILMGMGIDITERKRMEEGLRESGQRWATTLASVGDAVIVTDAAGRVTFMNGVAQKLTGWSLNEVSQRPLREVFNIINEYTRLEVEDPVAKVLEKGTIVGLANHTVLVRRDGSEVPIDDSGAPIRDKDGKTTGVVLVFRNITERKKAEEALKESEEKYRTLVETASEGIVLTNAGGVFTLVNNKMAEMLGYSIDEILGKSGLDFAFAEAEQRDKVLQMRNQLSKGSTLQGEFKFRRRDGSILWTAYNSSPIFDDKGQHVGNLSLHTDITERKKAEEALKENEQFLRHLTELSPAVISVSDMISGKEVYSNRDALALLGYNRSEIHDLNAFSVSIIHPDDLQKLLAAAEAIKKAEKDDVKQIEVRIKHADGQWHWLQLTYMISKRNDSGQPLQSMSFSIDITERKNIEEELGKHKERLEKLVEERTIELKKANESLQKQVTERQQAEAAVQAERKRLFDVLETLPTMVCLLTPDYHVAFANRSFRERFGESLGRHCYEYCFGRTEPCEFCESYNVLKTGQPHHWEVAAPDGSVIDAYDFPFTDVDGSHMILEMDTDITEHKRAEKGLRAASLYARSLIEVSLDPLVTISAEGKITDVNQATELATGVPRDKLIGSNFHDYFTEPEKAKAGYQQVFKEGFVRDYPLVIRHKSGKITDVLYNATVYRNEAGKVEGVFAAARDITKRKLAEERLRAASLYSRSLIEASLDPLVTISAEGKITDVNRATEDVTGCSREELIGSDVWEYFAAPERAKAGLREVLTKGFVKDYPLTIKHKSGKTTDVMYNATVYRNETGEIQGVFAAARDVTELKQTEEKLRSTSLYARSLIESSIDPLVTISAEGKITDVNRATELVTGVPRDRLIGKDFSDYFTEPDKAKAGYLQVFSEGFVRDYPLAIRHVSGRITDVLYNATVYRNEAGEIQGVFAAARDVTQRRQAEERIRQQAELLDKAHDAITVRDFENRITYWNRGAEEMYSWKAEEVIGKKANEILYKEEPSLSVEALNTVMESGEWSGELHQVTRDGKEITVDSRWTLMHDSEGNPRSILAINTDITDKKNLESQMLRAQRLESIGTLASGIAHDLNNILTPITLSIQLLQSEVKDEESRRTLDILEKSAQRGSDLVKQVLTFARGTEGERKPIQMKHIISEIERIMRETFPKTIEIQKNVSPDLCDVSGDATQLHQVIMNLCLNARDSMPDGGLLEISAENIDIDEAYARMHIDAKIGKYVVIAVADNGTGMPLEVREKLFEPFFTTKERGKGTGLGLSTALSIVRSHGGFINVYSEVGKGSIFKVYLPIIAAEEEKTEEHLPEKAQGKGELVLIVDDETPICQVTRSILESGGYRTITANDGAEAIALYAKDREEVKVILMDMAMPVMDGSMSIRALRKIDSQVKIVAVSGLNINGKLATITGLVNAFLAKPYTSEKLLETIDSVLNS